MGEQGKAAFRIAMLVALAVLAWSIGRYADEPRKVVPASATATAFSAARAKQTLTRILGPERPHPASSGENDAVRVRILSEFSALGITATTYRAMGCLDDEAVGAHVIGCGTVTDILAQVVPGSGKAIVMMAHYDSVPSGPGAADDGNGVAAILETTRALKAGGAHGHPVLALVTDGEEYGLLGAAAFVHNPALRARAGVVINLEARGSSGPSLLFQTSKGAAPLIDLYAANAPSRQTSSLYAEIYRILPSGTDLTEFLDAGIPSLNLAFAEGYAHYHTPRDSVANLSTASLQAQGEDLLGLVTGLEEADLGALKGGDAVYLTVLGLALPRLPQAWALPLSVVCLILFAVVFYRRRGDEAAHQGFGAGLLVPPLALIAAGALGFGLHAIAQAVSGMPDPSYAHPWVLRIALAFGVAAAVLAAAGLAGGRLRSGVWLWLALFAVAASIFAPGASPLFLFPCLIAAVLFLLTAFVPGLRLSWPADWLAVVAALFPLFAWMELTGMGETLGLKVHLLFTLPATFAVLGLLALLPRARGVVLSGAALALVLALGFAIAAGFVPPFSVDAPQRINIAYADDAGKRLWVVDSASPLPEAVRRAVPLSPVPADAYPIHPPAYIAPAPQFADAAPTARVTRGAASLNVALHGSPDAAQMYLVVPAGAHLAAVAIGDWKFAADPGDTRTTAIVCLTRDCAGARIALGFAAPPPKMLTLGECRFSLPPMATPLLAARDAAGAVQSKLGDGMCRFGDGTVVVRQIAVPGPA